MITLFLYSIAESGKIRKTSLFEVNMKNFPSLGIQIPDILLPAPTIDLKKWSVIACDQFTSQPEYWQKVAEIVGDSPSTFNITLPEIYLGKPEEAERLSFYSNQNERISTNRNPRPT